MPKKRRRAVLSSPTFDGTIPHQITSPAYKSAGKETKAPFINSKGVVIGDSFYDSPNSPLNNWSDDVDPSIMAGDEWVHPTNDIGSNTEENRELIEEQTNPASVPFMHPTSDSSYGND